MDFQKEAPIYLLVRRSSLENIGIVITNPFDYSQVVPHVTGFINTVRDHYFKPTVKTTTKYYDYKDPTSDCPDQAVRLYYDLDELIVAGASPFAPVLYSGAKGLLAGSQEFIGLEQNLGCYSQGTAPLDPRLFNMIFKAYSEYDQDTSKYIVYDLMSEPHTIAATVAEPPGYDAISFVPDSHISDQNPISTATGVYTFRIYPMIKIEFKN